MVNKKIAGVFLLTLMVSAVFVSAITGSIGNARMILRVEQGDVIEKYILVKNVNNVSIDVEVFASGDLEKDVEITDKSFTLEPGTEKKAYFKIEASKAGTTETNINVQFTPSNLSDGKEGVGLSSTVVVIAEENGWFDFEDEEEPDLDKDPITGNAVIGENGEKQDRTVLIWVMSIILVALFVLFILILTKTKSEKEVRRFE